MTTQHTLEYRMGWAACQRAVIDSVINSLNTGVTDRNDMLLAVYAAMEGDK